MPTIYVNDRDAEADPRLVPGLARSGATAVVTDDPDARAELDENSYPYEVLTERDRAYEVYEGV